MQIKDAIALVTGASSGIGYATAVRLAAAGARVVVHGRASRPLMELAERTGAVPVTAELSDPDAPARLAEVALAVGGRVDILINNAGVGRAGPFAELPPERIDDLITVNLAAPVKLTRFLLPQMLARGGGYLMFVTSIAGRMGVAEEAMYSATKAGLDVFAESLRFELVGTGVQVGVLVPGVVDTAFFARRGRAYERHRPRPAAAEVVADALIRAVASGTAERYVPAWLRLPVAVRGAVPGLYRRLGARFGGTR